MFHTRLKQVSYAIITAGVLLLLLGLWYTIPRPVESTTPEHVFWTWTVLQISFPLGGITLIVIGILNLRMFRLVQEETLKLQKELAELRQRIELRDRT